MTANTIDQIVRIERATDARTVGLDAYRSLIALLETLDESDWRRPTECPPWTVADMAGHLIGAAKGYAGLGELFRQQLYGVRHRGAHGGNALDATNSLQVAEHAHLGNDERIAALRQLAESAIDGRLRMPALLRRFGVPLDSGGSAAAGMPQRVNLGQLLDVVLTRDVWLHRIDIERATGRTTELDERLDGRIIDDVVAEWAGRHGRPFALRLTGPIGRHYERGTDGVRIESDAVEFCRILSGRAAGDGLLGVRVLF